MITSGALREERFILNAKSASDASLVKNGIAGDNPFLHAAPYGNRIDFSLEGTHLVLAKHSGQPFTYEEIHSFIKKIQLFERIDIKDARAILEQARVSLDSKLTLFYPHPNNSTVEVAFAYNWASIEFDSPKFEDAFDNLKEQIVEIQGRSTKVHSNHSNMISIHLYSVSGIYLKRHTLEVISNALASHSVIPEREKDKLVLRTAAFGVRSVTYMEARQMCNGADETFDFGTYPEYNPEIGDRNFLKDVMDIMTEIALSGEFSGLAREKLELLVLCANSEDVKEKYHIVNTIAELLVNFSTEFKKDMISVLTG